MRRRLVAAFAAVAIGAPAAARAQQPFATDDADVTPTGWVHFESFNEFDWLKPSDAPHLRQNTANFRINYGLGHGLELDLDSPLITIFNDQTVLPRRPFGVGDTNFGIKWNLRAEAEGSNVPAVTLATYIETPTGNSTDGLGSGLLDIWLYGVIQKSLTKTLVLRVNGGYLFTGNTSTGVVGITSAHGKVVTMGTSLQRQMSERLVLGGEVSAAIANDVASDHAQLQALFGETYGVTEHFGVDFAITGGHFSASPRFGIQLGFTLDLPRGSVP